LVENIVLRPRRREPAIEAASWDLAGTADHARSKKRAVTLIQAEHLAVIGELCATRVEPTMVRRNLVIRGAPLPALRKQIFRVGEVVLEGTGRCDPCSRMEAELGRGGYAAMLDHGGITAKILVPGVVRVADAVEHIPLYVGVKREFWSALAAAHATPGRHYHTIGHALTVAARVGRLAWDDPTEAILAALLHDAVYVPGRADNEEKSAALARELLADVDVDIDRVARLIALTARHGRVQRSELSADEARFLDCDMAILGADQTRFDLYNAGVAAEYAPVVDEAAFRAGRRAFLHDLLHADRIFLTDPMHRALDERARENLGRAIASL
jgi:predicted metal-dependent HD superfamily phosphohydrolase